MADPHTAQSDEQAKREPGRIGRRALLAGIGASGVSVAAIAAAGSTPRLTEKQPASPQTEPVYRETEHIRQFYDRSRF